MPANTIANTTTQLQFVATYNSHVANTNAIELAANTAQATANNALLAANTAQATANLALARAGGTMTGTLTLPAANSTVTPLIIPHGTAPTSPANGALWSTTTGLFIRVNGVSVPVGAGASGGGSDQAFYLNDQTITADYTIPSNKNAGTFGPVNIAANTTVTVSANSTWSIV